MAGTNLYENSNIDFLFDFISHHPTKHDWNKQEGDNLTSIIESVPDSELLCVFEELALSNYRDHLKNETIPTFCSRIKSEGVATVTYAVEDLYNGVTWFKRQLSVWPDNGSIVEEFEEIFLSSILWEINDEIKDVFAEYISQSLQSYLWCHETPSDDSEFLLDDKQFVSLEWEGKITKLSREDCSVFNLKHGVYVVNKYIRSLRLLHTLVEQPLMKVLGTEVRRYIKRTCGGDYEKKWLTERLNDWVETKLMSYIKEIFNCDESDALTDDACLDNSFRSHSYGEWKKKLMFVLYENYTEMRITEMFAIITDFPDSAPVIEDLRVCLEKTNQRNHLIETLRRDFANRVLHRGVSTGDMITMYISAVKALRMLDPSGVIMETVLEGYMRHLVGRDDTIRNIMSSLLDNDAESDLSAELANAPISTPLYTRDLSDSLFVEEITDDYKDWKPDPREADPTKSDKSHRRSDIISLLINMYGSTEKFITEYQKLLSKRLLSLWCGGFREDAEIKNLELLKLRFGETDMEKCGVMLKDVADSRRINTHVISEIEKRIDENARHATDISTLIISAEYWPDCEKYDIVLPEEMDEALNNFNKLYEKHKASRSLHWIHSQSRVDIEIELQNQTINLKVSPLLASIICLFELKGTWSLNDLSAELRVSESILRKNIVFWTQRGMLEEVIPNSYVLVEDVPATAHSVTVDFEEASSEPEDDGFDMENAKQRQQESVLWNFINGMLINLKSLPLERIQKMLKMFATHDPSMKMDETRLRALLNQKVQQGVLCVDGGQYCLNKNR